MSRCSARSRLSMLMLFGTLSGAVAAAGPDLAQLERACLDCHRAGLAPLIEGQNAEYLAQQLRDFRDQHRDSFPMSAVASAFDDASATRWAQALAALGWPRAAEPSASAGMQASGQALVEARGCRDCHGETLLGAGTIPRLAGQHATYLERQIRSFGSNDRFHAPLAGGTRMRGLDPDEIRDIAAWIAAQHHVAP